MPGAAERAGRCVAQRAVTRGEGGVLAEAQQRPGDPPHGGQAALAREEATHAADDVEAREQEVPGRDLSGRARATAPLRAPTPLEEVVGLVLGSPEFQRR